jgi:hypothetical protein
MSSGVGACLWVWMGVGGIQAPDQVPSSRPSFRPSRRPSSGPEMRSGVQEPLRLRRDLWLTLG